MNSSPNRASDASGKSAKRSTLELATAQKMLPLVTRIVTDIVQSRARITRLAHEQDGLDRNRRELSWAERSRRYAVHDELAQVEKNVTVAVTELGELGVMLIDPDVGAVDFPTRINGRSAAFSWQLGESGLAHWRYVEEEVRRPIPKDWQPGTTLRVRGEP